VKAHSSPDAGCVRQVGDIEYAVYTQSPTCRQLPACGATVLSREI
jgi:hypothetical protein